MPPGTDRANLAYHRESSQPAGKSAAPSVSAPSGSVITARGLSQEVRWQPRRQGDRCRTSRTGESTRRLAGTAGHQALPCSSSFFKPTRPTRSWACSGSAPSNHKWMSVAGKTLEPECRYNSFHGDDDQIRPCDSRTGILPMQGSQQGGPLPAWHRYTSAPTVQIMVVS